MVDRQPPGVERTCGLEEQSLATIMARVVGHRAAPMMTGPAGADHKVWPRTRRGGAAELTRTQACTAGL